MDQTLQAQTLQALCERGQSELMRTEYLSAAKTLGDAEARAWASRDFDTLSRLYLPLQEAHRQIRQRCGEGALLMHCFDQNALEIVQRCPWGQLLVAGTGTIRPAIEVRQLAVERSLYLQSFLGARYPTADAGPVIAIMPFPDQPLPPTSPYLPLRTADELRVALPVHSVLIREAALPPDAAAGTADSFAYVMDLWEQLHWPFLNSAASEPDPVQRMQRYRDTLTVDPACELAHQFLADIARYLARQ